MESGGSGIVWSGGRGMSSSGSAGRCRGGGGLSGRGMGLSMGIMSTASPLVTSGDELLLLPSSSPLPLQEKNQHLHREISKIISVNCYCQHLNIKE